MASLIKKYIFVHGLGLSSTIWDPISKFMPTALIIANDLPGHGLGPRVGYDFASLWNYIENLVPKEEWQSSVLILHSMAGALMPEILASSVKPSSIVLLEGNVIDSDSKFSHYISKLDIHSYDEYLLRLRRNAAMVLRSHLVGEYESYDLNYWSKGFTEVDAIALRQIASNLFKRTKSGSIALALQKISCPVLYLRGAQSESWDDGRKLLSHLKVPVFDIEDAGHYPMIDNPKLTSEIIMLNS